MSRRLIALAFSLTIMFVGSATATRAQSPTPTPVIQVNPGKMADTFSQYSMTVMKVLQYIRSEIEAPLNQYFYLLALALLSLLACAAYLRRKNEEDFGFSIASLIRFAIRYAVCAFVMTVVLLAADKMLVAGNYIAYGRPTAGAEEFKQSWLGKLSSDLQETFQASFERYTEGLFIVKVNGEPTAITDPGDGTVTLLGVPNDYGTSLVNATTQTLQGGSKWDAAAAYSRLQWGRWAVEGANLFNTFLPHLVLIFMRLFGVFACAAAIDKGLASRITWQWLWGMFAISILLPIVSQLLKVFAYLFGCAALQVGDPAPIWNWDYATMTVLKTEPGDPSQLVNVCFLSMLLMAGLLAAAIVVAYQLTMGRVYETGSQLISGYIWGGAAGGVGFVSAATSAAISRQAETVGALGSARAEGIQLQGQKESADLNTSAGAVAARASSKAGAWQGAMTAQSTAVASEERARSGDARAVREAEAGHQRVLTESEGRTQGTDVDAQNAANQARSGMSGTIIDAGKGIAGVFSSSHEATGGDAGAGAGAGSQAQPSVTPQPTPEPQPTAQGVGGPIASGGPGTSYGAPRDYDGDGRKDEHHTGTDYNSRQGFDEGNRVGVAANGRVIFAGRDGGYGNRVVVDHGNGVATSYSHLQDGSINNIAVGQEIKRGAEIGRVGQTGEGSGPHLHFETGTLAGGTDKYGAPNMVKVNPATTSYRPMNLGKGVDGWAAMPTQAGQAARESARLRELGTVNASSDYTSAMVQSSAISRDDEIGISHRFGEREAGYAWGAHAMRVGGINTQEKMNLNANAIMFDHGMKAVEERKQTALDTAALREKAAIIASSGSILAQQVGRMNEAYRF
jgi:murein DD-endopeptidase MepM/ murein hydrolase activator NlpD